MLYEFIMDVMVQTVLITFFVLSMILVLEYLNVVTTGHVHAFMQKHSNLQIIIASVLGLLPGCVGSYTAVSLYTHDVIGLGALMANLIATTGDEAFYMISLMPDKTLVIFGVLLALSVAVGYLVHVFTRRRHSRLGQAGHFELHINHDHHHRIIIHEKLADNFRQISWHRVVLLVSIVTFIVLTFCGFLGEHHDHGDGCGHDEGGLSPVSITFLVLAFVSLLVILWVPNHFLEEHIWHHVIGKHFSKVFVWTFVALSAIFVLNNVVDLGNWISQFSNDNVYFVCLAVAIIVGLIPESGPHVAFVSLYVSGTIPLGVLLANCIVQDGHGAIPLFAETRKDFFVVKGIKALVALVVGLSMWWF